MHSWTGNLVTNKNFEHFWLNEGWTVFLERKVGASLIKDPVEAKKSRDFQSLLGLQELNETVSVLAVLPYTKMYLINLYIFRVGMTNHHATLYSLYSFRNK